MYIHTQNITSYCQSYHHLILNKYNYHKIPVHDFILATSPHIYLQKGAQLTIAFIVHPILSKPSVS